ncbi:MAG: hypothetical protein FJX35_04580 [Alphaproteobacteria bacterium]|nr:hypothetical protein [Alphaproteobacteria bacterium]
MASRYQAALKSLGRVFDDPGEIVEAKDLTKDQKIKLLSEWEYDLRLQMVASEENMTADNVPPNRSAELFGRVRNYLSKLGAHMPEEPGVTKAG